MMKVLTPQMKEFLAASQNEEQVDQPIYSYVSYGTGGATSFTFFNTASGSATNGLGDTNMDAAAVLSAGKRFAVFGIGVHFIGSAPHVFNSAVTTSQLNDIKGVLEGVSYFQFTVLDKVYYTIAPLSYLPGGFGVFVGGAAYQRTQASAADGNGYIAYGENGVPQPANMRKLRVAIPIPQQVRFAATVNFPTAVTIGTASRIGVILDGILIRARQ